MIIHIFQKKTFTNDEIYQQIVNLYGADFVEKYYLVFDKVFGLIDISNYNIDDVQKNKLFVMQFRNILKLINIDIRIIKLMFYWILMLVINDWRKI